MNRIFGIAGFLAAGTNVIWVWLFLCLPWLRLYGSGSPSASKWMIWGAVSMVGVAIVFSFVRFSLTAHWAALLRNAAIPPAAWRGVCGVYLLVMLALALPVLASDMSRTHRMEMYLYTCLATLAFALSVVAVSRGFRRSAN